MHNTHILFLLLGLTIGGLYVQAENAKPITEQCLVCMCEALSGCNATAVCVNGACGIFRITWDQWVDSGRLTIQGDSPMTDTSFTNCANDPYCAADTLQSYMVRYGQDCNNDEIEDCYDYAAIHYMGPFNCKADMPYTYESVFKRCLRDAIRDQKRQISS
ncbi:lysozyme 2 [Drosophila subpulchrella]|uniref:lysozyme 2 n=1 Tax=Drosophila subpulchrella TaxID=1486046 RepID=UPI0018A14442|nr:lysozyme 2 [Drosophila subpulchrella]